MQRLEQNIKQATAVVFYQYALLQAKTSTSGTRLLMAVMFDEFLRRHSNHRPPSKSTKAGLVLCQLLLKEALC